MAAKRKHHPLTDYERETIQTMVDLHNLLTIRQYNSEVSIAIGVGTDRAERKALEVMLSLLIQEKAKRIKDGLRVSANERLLRKAK